MNDTYRRYLISLKNSCDTVRLIITALEQAPQASQIGDIDARIQAADKLISHMHDIKRGLIYFKNRLQ